MFQVTPEDEKNLVQVEPSQLQANSYVVYYRMVPEWNATTSRSSEGQPRQKRVCGMLQRVEQTATGLTLYFEAYKDDTKTWSINAPNQYPTEFYVNKPKSPKNGPSVSSFPSVFDQTSMMSGQMKQLESKGFEMISVTQFYVGQEISYLRVCQSDLKKTALNQSIVALPQPFRVKLVSATILRVDDESVELRSITFPKPYTLLLNDDAKVLVFFTKICNPCFEPLPLFSSLPPMPSLCLPPPHMPMPTFSRQNSIARPTLASAKERSYSAPFPPSSR